MKRFVLIALILAAVSALPVLAQPTAASPASKIVVIDSSGFFDEKSGITRILTAAKSLTTELAAKRTELEQMITRVQQVEKEVTTYRDNVAKGIPIDQGAATAKAEELDRLKREGKFKEEEYNAHVQKRQTQLVGPEYSAALRALDEYVKSKGYGMVFDVSKDQNGILIFATEQYNITKDFIAFYNARPPTAINSVPK